MRKFILLCLWTIVFLQIAYAQNQGGLVSCPLIKYDCYYCGQNPEINNQFSFSSQNWCFVKDCSSSFITKINGWVCNSCSTATGNGNIAKGKFHNGKTCVNACDQGQYASFNTQYECSIPTPGNPVSCSSDSQTCSGCEPTTVIDTLFTYKSGSKCFVKDCNIYVIRTNMNGWMCQSCNGVSGSNFQGQYFVPTARICMDACPDGTYANAQTGFNCLPKPVPGSDVTCSINSTDCSGCGSNTAVQSLFKFTSGTSCSIADCSSSVIANNLNGWVCNSCSTATGSNIIQKGQYYDPVSNQCMDTCPQGTQASSSTGFICQNTIPGINVDCSNDSSTCNGCGSTKDIQNLFTHSSGSSCSIKDCTATIIGNNLNGWVCNSCSRASGKNIIATGQFYDGSSCVSSCPKGQTADASTGYICKPTQSAIVAAGKPVSCSTDKSTCKSCEANPSLQNFFQYISENQCQVIDCSSPKLLSNLNAWVCASCDLVFGSIVPYGKCYDGSTCTSNCENASNNNAINHGKIAEFFFLFIIIIFL
ncbi:hypothetical protein ABPG73_022865 [Tetrahymena malaccensis]